VNTRQHSRLRGLDFPIGQMRFVCSTPYTPKCNILQQTQLRVLRKPMTRILHLPLSSSSSTWRYPCLMSKRPSPRTKRRQQSRNDCADGCPQCGPHCNRYIFLIHHRVYQFLWACVCWQWVIVSLSDDGKRAVVLLAKSEHCEDERPRKIFKFVTRLVRPK